jgi:predicted ATPase
MLLPSFYLENFRLFDRLEVKRLRRINLIVGRNNIGKSAFLEAIYIYAAEADPKVFLDLRLSRQEDWDSDSRSQGETKKLFFTPFRHFFKGHKIPLPNEDGFKLATSKNAEALHIKTAAYISEDADKGFLSIPRKLIDFEEVENTDSGIEICVVTVQGKNTHLLFTGDGRYGISKKSLFGDKRAIQLVPTQGISDRKAAQLWDAINLTDLADVVIDGLKLIEARLIGLAFVESETHEVRIPLIKLQNQKEPISLKSLGDGVTRVFHIMLALVNAKDGVLLIDEFENGLHWTVQESVWRVLFQMAARLNVQVFCTTHSRDCINAFDTIWREFENEGAFFRLYAQDNQIRVREYDLETLSDSLETDVDVR